MAWGILVVLGIWGVIWWHTDPVFQAWRRNLAELAEERKKLIEDENIW